MKKLNLFLILTLLVFGLMIQTAAAQQGVDRAVNLSEPAIANTLGPKHNARVAIAPYAQVVPNESYTFIGVTHPSLATAHTSIGLIIEAMDMTFTTSVSNPQSVKQAVVFTINAGETHRVFIVNEGHATIKASNTAFTAANKTHLITTSDDTNFGNIRVMSIGSEANIKTSDRMRYLGNYYLDASHATASTNAGKNALYRYDNLNQLSMWGVVYQESNGAGFSLEFVGDMHDSSSAGVAPGHLGGGTANDFHSHKAQGTNATITSTGAGRGVN